MRRFAEEEIWLPSGPAQGRRFRSDRQPFFALFFGCVESARFRRFAITGPTQTGKTLLAFVFPLLYHLFELRETVVAGVPDLDIARDKWEEDCLPVIEQTRYRDLLPKRGAGSRGAWNKAIRLENGATLRWMSGHGRDEGRAHFTARVAIVTETDRMDEIRAGSRESDPVSQIEGRTRAFGDRAEIWLECIPTFDDARIWREYQIGTATRIVVPCPKCGAWTYPERENLVGWQEAETERQARDAARWRCGECAGEFGDTERKAAHRRAVAVHKGQEVTPDGEVVGRPVDTETLSFRWSAFSNLFVSAAEAAADEWRAKRNAEADVAERRVSQQLWANPVKRDRVESDRLEIAAIQGRAVDVPRGVCPVGTTSVTVGVDLGKWLMYWIALAWRPGATPHVVDYGREDVPSDQLAVEEAVTSALREFRDGIAGRGWLRDDEPQPPDEVWVDAGWETTTVYAFIRESKRPYQAAMGFGCGQFAGRWYKAPARKSSVIVEIGSNYHVTHLREKRVRLAQFDADKWKSFVHARLKVPTDRPTAMTLFHAPPTEHLNLARQLTAEVETLEFKPGSGMLVRWEQVSRQNHWLDAAALACAAGYRVGERLPGDEKPKPVKAEQLPKTEWFKQQKEATKNKRRAKRGR